MHHAKNLLTTLRFRVLSSCWQNIALFYLYTHAPTRSLNLIVATGTQENFFPFKIIQFFHLIALDSIVYSYHIQHGKQVNQSKGHVDCVRYIHIYDHILRDIQCFQKTSLSCVVNVPHGNNLGTKGTELSLAND